MLESIGSLRDSMVMPDVMVWEVDCCLEIYRVLIVRKLTYAKVFAELKASGKTPEEIAEFLKQ